jgi:hypothetical protein
MNLLTLSCALNLKYSYKAFNIIDTICKKKKNIIDTICTLVEKYYPMNFNEQ